MTVGERLTAYLLDANVFIAAKNLHLTHHTPAPISTASLEFRLLKPKML